MATSITINGTLTFDESSGLQVGNIPSGQEDNNDNDVSLAGLLAAVQTRLFTDLALSNTFALADGIAKSADNFISVTASGTITSLGFVDGNGAALPIHGGAQPGVLTSLSAVNGGAIRLFADAVLGNRLVLGVDAQGDIVFAAYMDPNAALSAAKVWVVQFEPIANPDSNNADDPVNLFDTLGVAASSLLEFNFNALPSGQNLFGTVGTTDSGLVVIGKTPVLNADGTFTNASNTINTSQGGGPTTIGVNNQMFDPNDGAFFTFVKNPVANFLAGAPGGLTQGEADDADNIQYTGGTIEATSAFARISQIQGNGLASIEIKCFNMTGAPQGQAFVTTGLGTGPAALITAVRVFDETGQKIEDSSLPGTQDPNVTITITNGVATVTGLDANYKVEWDTSAAHDQVLITGVAGKFDIGGFGAIETTAASVDIGDKIRFEDSGPSITATAQGAPTLTVDETLLATNATGAFAAQFTSVFGTDGPGATSVTYALSTPGGNSGLVDTASGQNVVLSLVSGQVQGRTAVGNDLVFTVSVDGSGNVTLDQIRAVVHPTADPNESKSLAAANQVVLTATAIDGDADQATASLNIGQILVFKDDGPSITGTAQGAPTLTVDETVLATDATGAFAAQFTPVFGNDGAGPTPVTYALSAPGGNSGLVDTASGQAVVLSLVGGQVQGRTAVSNALVFTVNVDGSGNVTLDQIRAVVHPTADPNESKTLAAANQVVLTATANDGDADQATASLNIGQLLVFKDDGPSIGPIANSIVDFASGSSATKTLNGAVGADPNAAPYTIDSFTPGITTNNIPLQGVVSSDEQMVTYFADTNGDAIFGNTGDTAFYRLTLSEAAAGNYTFTVLVNPPPALLEFNFSALPSGQNLFGTVGTTDSGLVVIGKTPVLNADGTFTNASNTINTSQGGGPTTIGVNNQMFDPNDGAFFTFVKNPVANFLAGAPGGLTQGEADDADNIQYTGGTIEATSAFARISQIQGNGLASIEIKCFNMTGAPQGQAFVTTGLGTGPAALITAVRVFDETGQKIEDSSLPGTQDPNVTITITNGVATVTGLDANYKVEWDTSAAHDQVLITGVAGKFDIGGFGAIQTAPTPDQVLNFVAKATDGDTDSSTAAFSIGIDGTGIFDDGVVGGVTVNSVLVDVLGLVPMEQSPL